MIKLTVNSDNECMVYKLDQFKIMIGREDADGVDIPLNDPQIQPYHVAIEEQNNCFIVKNLANDPFTSLNGRPFGKKVLKNFDQIEIDQTKITFEFIEEAEQSPKEASLKQEISNEDPQNASIDIENLLREVEKLSISDTPLPAAPPAIPMQSQNLEQENIDQESESIEQKTPYYLQDFDDESEQWSDELSENEPSKPEFTLNMADKWKLLVGLFIAIASFGAVIIFGVYFSASGKNSQEEKKIAAGIADIAMAMTHARLNHITPNKQNWSDPNFIRNNLSKVLPPNLHTQAQIDSEGQFIHYPYRLRVYTSGDMEYFIIIAQPAPNLMQWLVHKKTILIDSETMQMRKVTDLKAINRLLANPNPLEDENGEEIRRLINEGQLMSLNSLSGHKNHWGFSPPKALGFIRPGAENYIYNAPRYYPFGEELLNKAIQIYQTPSSPSDVSLIQNEMEEVSKFKDIVLFTSNDLQMAIEAQQALRTFAPQSKFLVAYVTFNPKGFVASSHLLMNEEKEELTYAQPPPIDYSLSLNEKAINVDEEDPTGFRINEDSSSAEEQLPATTNNHPVLLELQAVYNNRKNELAAISRQMFELVNRHNKEFSENFNEEFMDLFQSYAKADKHHQENIEQELAKLYHGYSEMPFEEFLENVRQAKLVSFADAILEKEKSNSNSPSLSDDEILISLQSIMEAKDLEELSLATEGSSKKLSLENLPNPEKLIYYQELTRRNTLRKLSELLQSPQSPYSLTPPPEHHREFLNNILEYAWIRNHYEAEYFQQEFDYIVE